MSQPAIDSVVEFNRSEAEFDSLRSLCKEWGKGFWKFEDIQKAIALKTNLILYTPVVNDLSKWQGAVIVDLSSFNGELLYIFVAPSWRGSGVGSQLLAALIDNLSARGQMETLFLEVRTSNVGAIKLYESHGFSRVGERKKYYSDGEDALVYRYAIK
jgi:ribosomal-protein-alanine acetyltransferase